MNNTNPPTFTLTPKSAIYGTRVTLYNILSYLKAGWEPCLIQQWLSLSDQQMTEAIDYIQSNQYEIEHIYQHYLQETQAAYPISLKKRTAISNHTRSGYQLFQPLFSGN